MRQISLDGKIIFWAFLGIAFLLYGNTLAAGFVWDDHYLIEENPNLRDIAKVPGFFTKDFWQNSSINFQSGFYRPITLLSFFVNYHLWQGHPFGFHFFNILLHACNSALLALILLSLTKNRTVSFLAAIIFVAHPVQTESVAYIADVNDLLCVFFIFLSIWYYICIEFNRIAYFVLSAVSLWLAFFSKENAIIAFLLIPLVDWFFVSKGNFDAFKAKKWVFLSYVLFALMYVGLRVLILGTDNAVTTLQNIRYVSILPPFHFWSHILTVIKIIFLYVTLLFWPVALSISYVVLPAVTLFSPDVFFAALFLLILLALAFACFRTPYRWVSFSVFWFGITMLPVSNLIPISNTIAERFLYLPMVGFSVFLGYVLSGVREWLGRRKIHPAWFYAAVILLISLYSWKTVTRNLVWRSDGSLFASALNVRPCSPIAHRNLSAYYYRQKDAGRGLWHNQAYSACVNTIQKEYSALKRASRK